MDPAAPNPSMFAEFVDNRVAVGNRASHQPKPQNRDNFWSWLPSSFSMGMVVQRRLSCTTFMLLCLPV